METAGSDKLSLRSYFLNDLKKPVILKGYLLQPAIKAKWKSLAWSREDWVNLLEKEQYPVQFGKKISGRSFEVQDFPQWEYLNLKGDMTYEEMLQWEKGQNLFTASNKTKISREEYWAYLDYYYMKNLTNVKLADEIISWETLGFPDLKAEDSTIWIGTAGANTPCHLDTYGSNIVCQVRGRKQWTLFPKDQSLYLYPTRIPYEESSIYSEVGFPRPNLFKFPKLSSTFPFLVTLEAGDVLLVPKHWWHFVENLDFSISINTWVPLSTDPNDRLKEALVLFQVGSLCQSLTSTSLLRNVFHANMMDTLLMDSSELFQFLRSKVLHYQEEQKLIENQSHSKTKKQKLNGDSVGVDLKAETLDIHYVPNYSFEQYCALIGADYLSAKFKDNKLDCNFLSSDCSIVNDDLDSNIAKLLIKSFTDERVIQMLKNVLDENIKKL